MLTDPMATLKAEMLETDKAFVSGAVLDYLAAVGPDLRSHINEAGDFLLPEERDTVALMVWISLAAKAVTFIHDTTGRNVTIPVPEDIQKIATRIGFTLENPFGAKYHKATS